MKIAKKMIIIARNCGADAVKLQAGNAQGFARTKRDIKKYEKFILSMKEHKELFYFGEQIEIPVFFSIWSREYEDLLGLEKYHKIPARHCTKKFIEQSGLDSDHTFISVPYMMGFKEIEMLGIKKSTMLHCVNEYPAQLPMFNKMMQMKRLYKKIGFSDHFIGVSKSIEAMIIGATVIEKHFTLDHNYSKFRDHELSADPKELEEMCKFSLQWTKL